MVKEVISLSRREFHTIKSYPQFGTHRCCIWYTLAYTNYMKFIKKEKASVAVRVYPSTLKKLKALAYKHEITLAEVVEVIIDTVNRK